MENLFFQSPFLIAALTLFLIRLVYWKITELKADREKPRHDPMHSKKRFFTTAIGIIIILQVFGVQIFPFTSHIFIDSIGMVLVVIGVGVCIEGRRILGNNWTHAAEYQIKKDHELITEGIYHVIRHPIYSGFFLSVVGIEMILHSYLSVIFLVGGFFILNAQAEKEEKILREHFGKKYENYKNRTSRFIPLLW